MTSSPFSSAAVVPGAVTKRELSVTRQPSSVKMPLVCSEYVEPDGHEETVLRNQVEELRSTGLSYMPEGLEKQIDVPAMADLLAYLKAIK